MTTELDREYTHCRKTIVDKLEKFATNFSSSHLEPFNERGELKNKDYKRLLKNLLPLFVKLDKLESRRTRALVNKFLFKSETNKIDVGNEFSPYLRNKNPNCGDGTFDAISFRKKFLSHLEKDTAWLNHNPSITLDFVNVIRLSPSFAQEAFGHFKLYSNGASIMKKIHFINMSYVTGLILEIELGISKHGGSK